MLSQHLWICKSIIVFILFISKLFHNILESNQLNENCIYNLVKLSFDYEIFLSVELIMLLGIDNMEIWILKNFGKLVLSQIKVMRWDMISIFIRFKWICFIWLFSTWNFISKVLPIHDSANKFKSWLNILIKFFKEIFFKL
jgi:hypothetical protein